MMDEVVVSAVGLSKVFKNFWNKPKAKAVNDIDFEVRRGEVFALLGPNGSGKSTTVKMLLGLLYPTAGRLSVLGRSPRAVESKRQIGYLPEETHLYKHLTAFETLDFFGALFGLSAEERKNRADQLLEMVGLSHARNRAVGEFSKGMARRIGLAQAMINDPEFLILDEPTSGLDPIGCREVKDLILTLKKRGKTILVTSHLLSDIEDICDRVVILYGGKIRAEGELNELLKISGTDTITVPHLNGEQMKKVLAACREFAPEGEISVSHPRMSLEEFFLDVVAKAKADKTLTTAGAQSGGNIADYLKADAAPEDAENARILLEQLSSGTEQQEENISGSDAKTEAEKESSPAPALEILDNLNEKAEQPIGTEQAGSAEKPDLSAANDKLNDLLSHRDL